MIHYHGLPITPESAAAIAIGAGHAFVSAARPEQLRVALDVAQSFAIDNGAFSAWRAGVPITDWRPFYAFAKDALAYPNCDFVVIPDVIDGTERQNDALVYEWPLPKHQGAPVWHMHESLVRLTLLAYSWPRVCIGSSGEFARVGSSAWWGRMSEAMQAVCDVSGRPACRLHGLRMLNPAIFSKLPLASADSTNIARNVNLDTRWRGTYPPMTSEARALTIRHRIEHFNSPPRWTP